MKVNIKYQGKRIEKEWSHFAWIVDINGTTFEYKTGVGHSTPYFNKQFKRNKKPENSIAENNEWVHIPSIDSVLECLFSDAQAGNESFDEFCSNFGYSNDSLKALDIYRSCMETSKKLRLALGKEFNSENERIQSLNN